MHKRLTLAALVSFCILLPALGQTIPAAPAKPTQRPSSEQPAQDLEFEVSSFFANDKTKGWSIRSLIYIDPVNLTFKPLEDRRETSLEIHGVILGDNGPPAEQVTRRVPVILTKEEYERATREGVQITFDMPAPRPGAYQVRIAVSERYGHRIGSVDRVVTVPDLSNKQLAVSGIALQAVSDTTPQSAGMNSPAARRFTTNSDLYFTFVVYNGSPNLLAQAKLFRDGKAIKSTPEITLDNSDQTDQGRILTMKGMRLTPDLEPGDYSLQVLIRDKAASAKDAPVIQWVDFKIVK